MRDEAADMSFVRASRVLQAKLYSSNRRSLQFAVWWLQRLLRCDNAVDESPFAVVGCRLEERKVERNKVSSVRNDVR